MRLYLTELVRRTRAVCGSRLTGVVAVGSLVLGNYRYGRSDIDVTVVVEGPPPAAVLRELADALDHRRLPCPAAGLELVVYAADFACVLSRDAGYLLDLNTGAQLPGRAAFDTAGAPSFWYVIDRSVAHQDGIALYGPSASEVIAVPDGLVHRDPGLGARTRPRYGASRRQPGPQRLPIRGLLPHGALARQARRGWSGRGRGGESPSTDRGRGSQL